MKLELSAALVAVACAMSVASASPHEDLAYEVQEYNHDKTSGWIVEKLMTFKVGDKCWPKLMDKKTSSLGKVSGHARYLERFAKVISGDEWSRIEGSNGDRETHRKIVEKMIEDFKSKVHVTVYVEGDDCASDGNAMWSKMTTNTLLAIEKYPPKAGRAVIAVNATTKVKTVTIDIAKDGSTITVTGPRDLEPSGWSDVIEKAVKRVSTKN